MRTVRTFCLISFSFSLFPGQSNFKQGHEDNHTEFWTQRTLFPVQSSTFPPLSPRVAAFPIFIQTVQWTLTFIWNSIQHTWNPSYKNFARTLGHVPSKIPIRVREGTMAKYPSNFFCWIFRVSLVVLNFFWLTVSANTHTCIQLCCWKSDLFGVYFVSASKPAPAWASQRITPHLGIHCSKWDPLLQTSRAGAFLTMFFSQSTGECLLWYL